MRSVTEIQRHFGEAWAGVKFYFDEPCPPGSGAHPAPRFCEAIRMARSSPVIIRPDGLSCPGADYVFRWRSGFGMEEAAGFRALRRLEPESVRAIVSGTAVLERPPLGIGINTDEVPDVIVSYCQPATAMRLMGLRHASFEGHAMVRCPSPCFSACGSACAAAHISGEISLSFGCHEAREAASIGRDRMIVGMPFRLAERLAASGANLHLLSSTGRRAA